MKKKNLLCVFATVMALTVMTGCSSGTGSGTASANESAAVSDTASTDGASSEPEAASAEASASETEAADTSASEPDTASTDASAPVSGTVSTDGSTSMEEVIGVLGEAFMQENSDVTFTYNPTGSGSGIKAVQEGRCDIGLSSRSLKEEEKAGGLTETVLAYDGIAIIVNPENPVTDLAMEQIASIFKGEITNWSEVGGNDAEIVLIGREAGSGTRDGFESITETEDACQYRQELTSTGDVITTVSSNADAIGYASLASVKDSVKAVSVDGVIPDSSTVKDGTYAVQRPFVLVTKSDTALSDAAQKFFDFAISDNAVELIGNAGVVAAK